MNKFKVVLATKNPKKAVELQRMAPENIEILVLSQVPEAQGIVQADEDGKTFAENAKIKAEYWAEKLNMPCIGDDSGLEIEALDGYPGVHTKRCMEILCPGENIDVDNPGMVYPKFLELIRKSKNPKYDIKWTTSMAYACPGTETIVVTNSLHGDLCECAGDKVFGFDQYFKPKGYEQTLAQMAPEEKDKIGPRKKSVEELIKKLLG